MRNIGLRLPHGANGCFPAGIPVCATSAFDCAYTPPTEVICPFSFQGANLVMRHNRLGSWWLTVSVLTGGEQLQSVQADEVLPPRETCEMHRLASVNIKRTSTGSILVPVSINGVAALI